MPNYYNDLLAQLMQSGLYDWNQNALARMDASEEETREFQRRTRKRGKAGKGTPSGAYAMAEYPELWYALQGAQAGLTPSGSAGIGLWLQEQRDPRRAAQGASERRSWADRQREILGMGRMRHNRMRRR